MFKLVEDGEVPVFNFYSTFFLHLRTDYYYYFYEKYQLLLLNQLFRFSTFTCTFSQRLVILYVCYSDLGKKKTNNHIQVKKKTSSSLGNHPYLVRFKFKFLLNISLHVLLLEVHTMVVKR
ncbi:hypothetical protein Hanom_Chr01g00093541 [Helianthus anomalus]